MSTPDEIHANIESTQEKIRAAAEKSGRSLDEVTLMIVSKTWPSETIRHAIEFPYTVFGESRVQEVLAKVPELPDHLDWHFIGHLQKNKIRKVLPLCDTFHSVDSLELAGQIDRIAAELGLFPKIYLQVNVAEDGKKFGFEKDEASAAVDAVQRMERLELVGLMTIPALASDPEDSRPHFAALRELRDSVSSESGVPLPGLSMGMTGDYPIAIEEGATIVRVGSAIFGKRAAWKG